MRPALSLWIFTVLVASLILSCINTESHNRMPSISDSRHNQTQFTFLAFDAASMQRWNAGASISKESLASLLALGDFDSLKATERSLASYNLNTQSIAKSDVTLARSILQSAMNGEKKYVGEARQYLYYYNWLPKEFSAKWVQTEKGHFEFDATFFAELRDASTELDQLIYGTKGHWPAEWKLILEGHIYNEITPESAMSIRKSLLESKSLQAETFKQDRTLLLQLLNKVIAGEWRLLLLDWG